MQEHMLDGQIALITGAAGAIGRAIAEGFARAGAHLCLADIDSARLSECLRQLEGVRGSAEILDFVLDVRDSHAVAQAFARAAEHFGRIDILVNNAAVTRIRRIDEILDSDVDEIIDTNLKGYFYFAREFVRLARRNGSRGAILIVSSKNGLEGASEKSLYCAAKGGEIAMARSLARELGPLGIRVNTICPDAVHRGSKLWERGGHYSVGTAKRYNITEEQIPEYYRARCALRVNIEPEDVARAALFLCSEESSKITGSIITVDGGVAFVR